MANNGKLQFVVRNNLGIPVSGASVTVRKQGATVNSNQAGTAPLSVAVDHIGGIVSGDSIAITAGTDTYACTAASGTTVTLDGFVGTLSLNDEDRLSPVGNLPTIYNDYAGNESASNPVTSGGVGRSGVLRCQGQRRIGYGCAIHRRVSAGRAADDPGTDGCFAAAPVVQSGYGACCRRLGYQRRVGHDGDL